MSGWLQVPFAMQISDRKKMVRGKLTNTIANHIMIPNSVPVPTRYVIDAEICSSFELPSPSFPCPVAPVLPLVQTGFL